MCMGVCACVCVCAPVCVCVCLCASICVYECTYLCAAYVSVCTCMRAGGLTYIVLAFSGNGLIWAKFLFGKNPFEINRFVDDKTFFLDILRMEHFDVLLRSHSSEMSYCYKLE